MAHIDVAAKWRSMQNKPFAASTDEEIEAYLALQGTFEPNPYLRVDRTVFRKMRGDHESDHHLRRS